MSPRTETAPPNDRGMTKAERVKWYRIAESIPLSQRHAGHILGILKRQAA